MAPDDMQAKGYKLLLELDGILSRSGINEIGFVPQTTDLPAPSGEPGPSNAPSELPTYDPEAFWCTEGKLAIAFPALSPLAAAAAEAFRRDRRLWSSSDSSEGEGGRDVGQREQEPSDPAPSENEGSAKQDAGGGGADCERGEREEKLMRWSRVLVLVNSDHATAWNTRKRIILRRLANSGDERTRGIVWEELWLSEMVLSLRPKSGDTWAHRRWVLQQKAKHATQPITSEDFERESLLVQQAAERNVMNYRAWSHRCRLIPLLSLRQVTEELERTTQWVRGQPADNCGFHYRRCLLQRLLPGSTHGDSTGSAASEASADFPVATFWRAEEELNADMILRFPGREALWIHRRFLFFHAYRSRRGDTSVCPELAGTTSGGLHSSLTGPDETAFVARCVAEAEEDSTENGIDQRRLAAAYELWCLHVRRDFPAAIGTPEHVDETLPLEEVDVCNVLSSTEEAKVRARLKEVCPWMYKLWSADF